jgi:hypothetical protein
MAQVIPSSDFIFCGENLPFCERKTVSSKPCSRELFGEISLKSPDFEDFFFF